MSTHAGRISTPGRFSGLPSTPLGRTSVVAFLVGLVLVVLMSTVLESNALTVGNLNVLGAGTFLVLAVALVTGALALIRDRERSWAVWLSTVLPAIVLGFEIISLVMGG